MDENFNNSLKVELIRKCSGFLANELGSEEMQRLKLYLEANPQEKDFIHSQAAFEALLQKTMKQKTEQTTPSPEFEARIRALIKTGFSEKKDSLSPSTSSSQNYIQQRIKYRPFLPLAVAASILLALMLSIFLLDPSKETLDSPQSPLNASLPKSDYDELVHELLTPYARMIAAPGKYRSPQELQEDAIKHGFNQKVPKYYTTSNSKSLKAINLIHGSIQDRKYQGVCFCSGQALHEDSSSHESLDPTPLRIVLFTLNGNLLPTGITPDSDGCICQEYPGSTLITWYSPQKQQTSFLMTFAGTQAEEAKALAMPLLMR